MPIFTKKPDLNQPNPAAPTNQATNQETKGLVSLPPVVSQFLPFLPLLIEQLTGQKIPQMSGTIADIQAALQQIQASLSQALTNQTEIAQRIEALESQASHQLTNLARQVQTIQAIRLTHEKEKKQIEYQQPNLNPIKETYD